MPRWLLPLLAGSVAAIAAYQVVLVETPRFLMSAAVKRVGVAGMNRMSHAQLATDRSRAIVRPSPDLAYSSCPFDLAGGPIRITVPPIPSAYWSLSVFDARTDVAFVRNNRETNGRVLDVVLIGKGDTWDKPPGVTPETIGVAGTKGIALVRVLVEDRQAFGTIDAARRKVTCRPIR